MTNITFVPFADISPEDNVKFCLSLQDSKRSTNLEQLPDCMLTHDYWASYKVPSNMVWFGVVADSLVGWVMLDDIKLYPYSSAWLHHELSPSVYGRGYARAAFTFILNYGYNTLGLHKISTTFDASDRLMMNFSKRFGAIQEGVFKDYMCVGGVWRDYIIMSKINKETN